MASFFRTKTQYSPGDGDCIAPFFVTEKQKNKFNELYAGKGFRWGIVERMLHGKTVELAVSRIPNNKENEPKWEGFLPIPDRQDFLKIIFVPARRCTSFFVLDIHVSPAPRYQSDVTVTIVPDFTESEPGWCSETFSVLIDDLQELPERKNLNLKVVKEQYEDWRKYLKAAEKIAQEKSILIKVKKWNRHRRKKGEEVLDFTLDTKVFGETLKEKLTTAFAEQGINDVYSGEKEGRIELTGSALPDANILAEMQRVLQEQCYEWAHDPSKAKKLLRYTSSVRYADAQARSAKLDELEGTTRAAAIEFRRQQNKFQFTAWDHYATWAELISREYRIYESLSAPLVKAEWKHELDNEQARMDKLIRWADQIAAYNPSVKYESEKNSRVRVSAPADFKLWPQYVHEDILLISVSISGQAKRNSNADTEITETQSDLKSAGDAEITGEQFTIRAPHPEALRQKYQAFKKQNPEFSFPAFEKLSAEYTAGLLCTERRGDWLRMIREKISHIQGLKWQGEQVVLHPHTEEELKSVLKQMETKVPGLRAEVKEISNHIVFRHEREQEVRAEMQKFRDALTRAFGKNGIITEHSKTSGAVTIELTVEPQTMGDIVMKKLAELSENQMMVKPGAPQESLVLLVRFSEQLFRKYQEELNKKLKKTKLKFLNALEKAAYEKEIESKSGSSRGGKELGNMGGIRDGSVRVFPGTDSETGNLPEEGYLLPVVVGDLAQIRRLKSGMELLQKPEGNLPANRNINQFLFDAGMARPISLQDDITDDRTYVLDHKLNEAGLNVNQREAVWKALKAKDMVLIQGPPGTGKTTVIAEIIWQALQEDPHQRILISSQSHLAVDNALQKLYRKNEIRPLRIAAGVESSKRVEEEGRQFFMERMEKWANAATDSKEEEENRNNAVANWILRILEGIQPVPEFAKEQEKWIELLRKPNTQVKQMLLNVYKDSVNVVGATCLECFSKDFKDSYKDSGFDIVIIDEASKATPPEMLLPLVYGRKVVIIGDHKQLPPMIDEHDLKDVLRSIGETVLADDMEDMKVSQFEKLFGRADESIRVTLNEQYRMHESIMKVIAPFYVEEGGLICGITKEMDKPDFSLRGSRWHGLSSPPLLAPENHVVWVQVDSPEIYHSPSYSNDGEVEAVRKVLEHITRAKGFEAYMQAMITEEDKEIGIVSFYGKQVEKLQEMARSFKDTSIRLRTVDKFQGMERNIMIVSTVRSHTQEEDQGHEERGHGKKQRKNTGIGFAKDFRRVNVAFSRARRLLIIVGNEDHFVRHNKIYGDIKTIISRSGMRITSDQL